MRAVIGLVVGSLAGFAVFTLFLIVGAVSMAPAGLLLLFPPVALFLAACGIFSCVEIFPWLPVVIIAGVLAGECRSSLHATVFGGLTGCVAFVLLLWAGCFIQTPHMFLLIAAHSLAPAAAVGVATWHCGWPRPIVTRA